MTGQFSRAYALVVVIVSMIGSTTVMGIAMGVSYETQAGWLMSHGVLWWVARAVPLTVDILALMANLALKLPRLPQVPGQPEVKIKGRWVLWLILLATLGVSFWWNLAAGKNPIDASAHCWVVLAYLMAEYIVNFALRYWLTLKQILKAIKAAVQEAATRLAESATAAVDLPNTVGELMRRAGKAAAPVSPAPKTRGPGRPRKRVAQTEDGALVYPEEGNAPVPRSSRRRIEAQPDRVVEQPAS